MDNAGGSVPSIAEQVAQVPTDPGCYLWKDASGQVIYVARPRTCAPACASTSLCRTIAKRSPS